MTTPRNAEAFRGGPGFKRELERIEIPGEHEARVRTWEVVLAAYAEREPTPSWRVPVRLLVAAAAAAALAAAILSPPGRALLDEVREAIGVEHAAPALFRLPDGGQLLVQSDEGPWVVQPDGSKRLLGRYDEASWSPFGRFVVAARENELVALEPDGDVRWKLSRRDVRFPRWGGSRTDTRIAYLSGSSLRVVAGDGKGDRLLARDAVALAWEPAENVHVLAYADRRGRVHVVDADSGRERWRSSGGEPPSQLVWSRDTTRLLAVGARTARLFQANGVLVRAIHPGGSAAVFHPRARSFALLRSNELRLDGRRLFAGRGRFTDVAWSPDGRWLLVAWRDADQWIFVRADGKGPIRAVANVSAQFESATFPRVVGWCCPAS